MTLNQLIDELRRNILRDVSDAVSADEADLLWTDDALTLYINDAYFRFCHLTEYLQDATTEAVCYITIVQGQREYDLNPAVIRVLSAEFGNLILPVTSTDHMHGDQTEFASYQSVRREDYPGVYAVVPDYEIGKLIVVGTPAAEDAGKKLRLRVSRYPLERLTLDEPDKSPEIPERFHLDMIEWAAFRALRNHDVDAENMAKASAHSTRFERAVEEVRNEFRMRKFSRVNYTESWGWN